MTTASTRHRLDGLEPDNLLAFLALLGSLRAIEASDTGADESARLRPRVSWDRDRHPLRPTLVIERPCDQQELASITAEGLDQLGTVHNFKGRKDLDYSRRESRDLLASEVRMSSATRRERIDLLAALLSDGVIRDTKEETIAPTPLCLLFGQGHQHFLERLSGVPALAAPPVRGRGKNAIVVTAADAIRESLFDPWHRTDPTGSFRWDPEEDVRYALIAADPTSSASQRGTQHGANRLAAVGLSVLTLVPRASRGRIRGVIIGGEFSVGGFSFAWPIWKAPASLAAIVAMLSHPQLRDPNGLSHLDVDLVMVARRISVGKFMNFGRARPLT